MGYNRLGALFVLPFTTPSAVYLRWFCLESYISDAAFTGRDTCGSNIHLGGMESRCLTLRLGMDSIHWIRHIRGNFCFLLMSLMLLLVIILWCSPFVRGSGNIVESWMASWQNYVYCFTSWSVITASTAKVVIESRSLTYLWIRRPD